jgi:hypothetical protein
MRSPAVFGQPSVNLWSSDNLRSAVFGQPSVNLRTTFGEPADNLR